MCKRLPSRVSLALCLCLSSLWGGATTLAGAQIKVLMILWDGSTPNEAGFQEGLRETGYTVGFDIVDAHGDMQRLNDLLQQPQLFDQARLLYVATATVLKAVLDKHLQIPIIFRIDSHAATHDIGASLKQSHPQITGICNNVQFALQQRAIQQLLTLRRLGFIYDPGSDDAVAELQYLRQVTVQEKFTLVEIQVSDPAQLSAALDTLAQARVDVLYLPPDPFVIRYSKLIVQLATRRRIPTFTGIERLVLESGALFALAGNRFTLGKAAARQAEQILQGESPMNIPVLHAMNFAPVINLDTAKALHMTIPVSVLLAAKKVQTTPGQ